jgi:hypothetical protein
MPDTAVLTRPAMALLDIAAMQQAGSNMISHA